MARTSFIARFVVGAGASKRIICWTASAGLMISSTAHASPWTQAPTAGTSLVVDVGYPSPPPSSPPPYPSGGGGGGGSHKKNKFRNLGVGFAAFAIAVAIASSNQERRRRYDEPRRSRWREPKRTYTAETICEGGRVRSGKCVCDSGDSRTYHGSRRYSCVTRTVAKPKAPMTPIYKTASEPAPEPPKAAPVATLGDYAPDEILVTFPAGSASDALEQEVARAFSLETRDRFDSSLLGERIVVFGIRDGRSVETVLAALRPDARGRDPQPNYYYSQQGGAGVASGASNPLQYAFAKIELSEAQSLARGRGTVIALLDSLIDPHHPDLKASVAGIYDVTRQSDYAIDAHSTAVAGLMTASGALRGVAPEARLLSVRVVKTIAGQPGQPPLGLRADTQTLARGVEWAVSQNARVLVLPLLGRHDPFVERIVKAAAQRQAVIVAPAGNAGPGAAPAYPGAYEDVIAVTATDSEDRIYELANSGGYIGVAAPGVNVLVLGPNRGHQFQSGTSLAAAHVAGVAALMIGYDPQLTGDAVRKALQAAAHDLGAPGRDQKFGAGRVSAYAALRQLKQPPARRDLAPSPGPYYAPAQGPVSIGSIGTPGLAAPSSALPQPQGQVGANAYATAPSQQPQALIGGNAYSTAPAPLPQPQALGGGTVYSAAPPVAYAGPAPLTNGSQAYAPASGLGAGPAPHNGAQTYTPAGGVGMAPPQAPVAVGSIGVQQLVPVRP